MSKRELIIIAAGLAAFVAVMVILFFSAGTKETSAAIGAGYTVKASSETERRAFLNQFGWQVEADPVSVREVKLPGSMDEQMADYNAIQQRQGFDLSKLCGQRVKLWTYTVTNYPTGGKAVANLLVKDGVVVGGDISSVRTGGFSHGFDPNAFTAETAAAQLQSASVDRSVPDRIPTDEHVPPEQDGDEE